MKRIITLSLIGCIVLTTVIFFGIRAARTPASATPAPQPVTTEAVVIPTSSSPGNSISWENLQVIMDQPEFSETYETDYGSTRMPPAGGKYLWVHIGLKNTGQVEAAVPASEHFSVLYASTELKPTYGHRAGYKDYTTLPLVIFPDQMLDGWLRFDVPAAAELSELLFVFLPESSQIGASYGSPNFPYAEDKPTYVWDFEP